MESAAVDKRRGVLAAVTILLVVVMAFSALGAETDADPGPAERIPIGDIAVLEYQTYTLNEDAGDIDLSKVDFTGARYVSLNGLSMTLGSTIELDQSLGISDGSITYGGDGPAIRITDGMLTLDRIELRSSGDALSIGGTASSAVYDSRVVSDNGYGIVQENGRNLTVSGSSISGVCGIHSVHPLGDMLLVAADITATGTTENGMPNDVAGTGTAVFVKLRGEFMTEVRSAELHGAVNDMTVFMETMSNYPFRDLRPQLQVESIAFIDAYCLHFKELDSVRDPELSDDYNYIVSDWNIEPMQGMWFSSNIASTYNGYPDEQSGLMNLYGTPTERISIGTENLLIENGPDGKTVYTHGRNIGGSTNMIKISGNFPVNDMTLDPGRTDVLLDGLTVTYGEYRGGSSPPVTSLELRNDVYMGSVTTESGIGLEAGSGCRLVVTDGGTVDLGGPMTTEKADVINNGTIRLKDHRSNVDGTFYVAEEGEDPEFEDPRLGTIVSYVPPPMDTPTAMEIAGDAVAGDGLFPEDGRKVLIVTGTLTIPEGVTVDIPPGYQIILNGKDSRLVNNGTLKVRSSGSEDMAEYPGSMAGLSVCNGRFVNNGSVVLAGTDDGGCTVYISGKVVNNGRFTAEEGSFMYAETDDNPWAGPSDPITLENRGNMELRGAMACGSGSMMPMVSNHNRITAGGSFNGFIEVVGSSETLVDGLGSDFYIGTLAEMRGEKIPLSMVMVSNKPMLDIRVSTGISTDPADLEHAYGRTEVGTYERIALPGSMDTDGGRLSGLVVRMSQLMGMPVVDLSGNVTSLDADGNPGSSSITCMAATVRGELDIGTGVFLHTDVFNEVSGSIVFADPLVTSVTKTRFLDIGGGYPTGGPVTADGFEVPQMHNSGDLTVTGSITLPGCDISRMPKDDYGRIDWNGWGISSVHSESRDADGRTVHVHTAVPSETPEPPSTGPGWSGPEYVVIEDETLEEGTEVHSTAEKVRIGEGAVVTVPEGTVLDLGTADLTVEGTLVVRGTLEVSGQVEYTAFASADGRITVYSGDVGSVLDMTSPGETVSFVGTRGIVTGDHALEAGTSLHVGTGQRLVVSAGSTFELSGTVVMEDGGIIMAGEGDIRASYDFTGTIVSSSAPDHSTGNYPDGAYYSRMEDGAETHYIRPLSDALPDIGGYVDGRISLHGDHSAGTLEITGTPETEGMLEVMDSLTVGRVMLTSAGLSVPGNASFSGTVAGPSAELSFDGAANDFTAESSSGFVFGGSPSATATVTGDVTLSGLTCGSIVLRDGDVTVDGTSSLGSVSAEGTVGITGDSSVRFVRLDVLGAFSVAEGTRMVSDMEGAESGSVYVGDLDGPAGLGSVCSVTGDITSPLWVAAEGTDLSAYTSGLTSVGYRINGVQWATAHGVPGTAVPVLDTDVTGFGKAVWAGLPETFPETAPEKLPFGNFVTAAPSYTVRVAANPALGSVTVDGTDLVRQSDGSFVSSVIGNGTHTVAYTVAAGYRGTGTAVMDGISLDGTFETSGPTPVDGDGVPYTGTCTITVTGLEAIPPEPAVPEEPEEDTSVGPGDDVTPEEPTVPEEPAVPEEPPVQPGEEPAVPQEPEPEEEEEPYVPPHRPHIPGGQTDVPAIQPETPDGPGWSEGSDMSGPESPDTGGDVRENGSKNGGYALGITDWLLLILIAAASLMIVAIFRAS